MDINFNFKTVTITLISTILATMASAAGTNDIDVVHLPNTDRVESRAYAVSADGSIVAGLGASEESKEEYEAFRWQNGQVNAIKALPNSNGYCCARGVSADGSIIVGKIATETDIETFIWQNGEMAGLGNLIGNKDDYVLILWEVFSHY